MDVKGLFHVYVPCFLSGLGLIASILAYMFNLVESKKITVQLDPKVPVENNMVYVQEFLLNLLKTAFPHLNK